ncbi:MAG: rod shape-determining protein MreD [Vicingaceae bacterium]
MINIIGRYALTFVLLVLLQVLVFNNLHLSFLLNPYVYVLFILLLPFETPGWLTLSLAFFTGLVMDAFCNTMGLHTMSIVLLAFGRKYLLELMAPRDGYDQGKYPHYSNMGLFWFIIYGGILTLIHHLCLFILEDFRLAYFLLALAKSFLSTLFSMAIMLILMLFSYKPSS